MMAVYKARVEQGQRTFAGLHLRDLSSANMAARQEMERREED